MLSIYNNCAVVSDNMFGDRCKYQGRAREAFPILIEKAKQGEPIQYGELAKAIGIEGAFAALNMHRVLGSISNTLCWYQKTTGENLYMRRLSMIVVKQHNRLASWVVDDLRKLLGREPSFADYESEVLSHIFNYDKWDIVRDIIETELREKL
ncbi:hypothetical protein F4212_12955 [Candidatus Poribacteria bacterium]|nr:hypothetical protein [Candidatus Poribacteria bacterium]